VRFHERCDFEAEIETVVYLQKALEPLIERCSQFLRERQAGVQSLELRLRHRVDTRDTRAPGVGEHHERAPSPGGCAG